MPGPAGSSGRAVRAGPSRGGHGPGQRLPAAAEGIQLAFLHLVPVRLRDALCATRKAAGENFWLLLKLCQTKKKCITGNVKL